MGRNNHHAGLHMIRYDNRYRDYEDLEYYDKLAIKKLRDKKIAQEREAMREVEEQKLMVKTEQNEIKNVEKNVIADDLKKQQENKHQKEKEEKTKSDQQFLIEIDHFINLEDLVSFNIMRIAIQKKLDISRILDECESMMYQDKRINPDPQKRNSGWDMPKLSKSLIFLSILAEKLECNIAELFFDNKEVRKQFVYGLLDELNAYFWESDYRDEDDEELGNMSIYLRNFDFRYGLAETDYGEKMLNREISLRKYLSSVMNLEIKREYYDGIPYYTIYFGTKNAFITDNEKYLFKGAYLWEEENGKLKEFAEKMFIEVRKWYQE